jgi:hypothetical protein
MKFHPSMVYGRGCIVERWRRRLMCLLMSGFRFPPWDWGLGPSHAESEWQNMVTILAPQFALCQP